MSAQDADWSKAPEGATHYLAENEKHGWVACWYKYSSNEWLCINDSNRHRWLADNDDVELFEPMLIKRPAPAWNGEGLPPVGTVCELRTNIGGWGRAEIKYMSSTVCVWLWIRFDGGDQAVEWSEPPYKMEFRPIRTTEQIAADERHAAIQHMALQSLGRCDCIGAAYLYDAGYRKSPERAK